MFENLYNLNDIDTETKEKNEQRYNLISSNIPFSPNEGIDYWVENNKIKVLK